MKCHTAYAGARILGGCPASTICAEACELDVKAISLQDASEEHKYSAGAR